MSSVDDDIVFDSFMTELFSRDLDGGLSTALVELLDNIIDETEHKKIDGLINVLNSENNDIKQVLAVNCLKKIGSQESLQAVNSFYKSSLAQKLAKDRAEEWLREKDLLPEEKAAPHVVIPGSDILDSFHNKLEYGAEYIFLPAGTLENFSLTKR